MISIRRMNISDKNQFDELIKIIEDNVTNHDLWMPIKKEARSHFFDESWTLLFGYYIDDVLVGSSALFLNEFEYKESVDAIGGCISPIAEIGRCMVLPKYRNQGIMLEINKVIVNEAKKMGIKTLIATAHPKNYASNATLIKLGMEIVKTINKEGKYLRNVLRLFI